ncbi:hypothetical protein Tco_0019032 [Tanacetum coccineum]
MSDSEDSTVTYTAVSSPFEDGSDIGSPGVDGPPIMPEDPYAYIMAAYQIHQDMFLESDPEEEPEEDDEDHEEDPADYLLIGMMLMMMSYLSGMSHPYYSPREEVDRLSCLNPPHHLSRLLSLLFSLTHFTIFPQFPASPPASPIARISSGPKDDRPEITLPPRKRLGIDLGPRYEIGESSAAAATRLIWRSRTHFDIYAVIEDTQDRQTQIYQSVETLFDDSQYHYETARLLDQEALVSREAWGRSIEVSYMTRSEILALHSVVIGQQAVISQLQAADRKSQVVTLEMLQADYQRQVQLAEALKLLKGPKRPQMGRVLEATWTRKRCLAQPDAPGEAGSSS